MTAWLVIAVGVAYACVAAELAWKEQWWQALVFFGYAVSNIGLWKLAQVALK